MTHLHLLVPMLFVTVALNATAQNFAALPKLKPGLWELTKTSDRPAAKANGPQVSSLCLDDSVKPQLLLYAQDMLGTGQCSDYTVKASATAIDGISSCKVGGSMRKMKSAIKVTGDSAFKSEVDATYDPPLFGSLAKAHTSIDAKYIGACPAGAAPGDLKPAVGLGLNLKSLGDSPSPKISP